MTDDTISITIRPMTCKQIEKIRGKNVWGFCRQDSYNKFFIAYDKNLSALDIIWTLFHEFAHVVCGLFATHYGRKDKAEETFVDSVGLNGRLMFQWYMSRPEE